MIAVRAGHLSQVYRIISKPKDKLKECTSRRGEAPIPRHDDGVTSKDRSETCRLSAVALLLIFVVAVLVRGVALSRFHQGALLEDIKAYDALGWGIAATGEMKTLSRPVGFPLFLALIYSLFGHSPVGAAMALGFLNALSVPVLAWATAVVAGHRRGWWAGLLYALYPGVAYHSVVLGSDGFAATLFALVLAAAFLLLRNQGLSLAFAAGFVCGWLSLVRTPLGAVGPFVGLGLFGYGRRRAAVALVVASLILPLLWAAQTKRTFGSWTIGDSNAGFNLYVGNNPEAIGRFVVPTAISTHRFVDEFQRDAFYRRTALEWIFTNPVRFGQLMFLRLGFLMTSEHKDIIFLYSRGWLGERGAVEMRTILAVYFLGWLLLVPLALYGAVACWRECSVRIALLAVVGGVIMYLISLGDSRFHIPLVPGVIVVAAWGATTGATLKALGTVRTAVLAALLLLFFANEAIDVIDSWPVFKQVTSPGGSSIYYAYQELR
ncbi:MAG: hypothetical protein HY278_11725 [candidate division NC10 bacterium]|nr:hypothetical protein [candidate division NC10 bacterium]